jgi:hypothetical protein
MSDAMDYTIQIASFGFLGGYLAVCVAAPAYLYRTQSLGLGRILIAAIAVSVIGAAFFLSLFPIPDAPWRYLPYIFVGILALGMLLSWRLGSKPGSVPRQT